MLVDPVAKPWMVHGAAAIATKSELILIITELMCNFQLSTLNMSRINYASALSSVPSSSYKTENLKKSNMKLPKVMSTTVNNHDANGHKGYGEINKPKPLYREFINYNYEPYFL